MNEHFFAGMGVLGEKRENVYWFLFFNKKIGLTSNNS